MSNKEKELNNKKRLQKYREIVNQANANRKICLVYDDYFLVRNELLRRGWIEKIVGERFGALHKMSENDLLLKAAPGNDHEKVLLSKMTTNYPAYFVWLTDYHNSDIYMDAFPYRNRVRIGSDYDFGTKLGFISCAENSQWYSEADQCELKFPRFHRLTTDEEIKEFREDFRLTECISLVSYLNDLEFDKLYTAYAISGEIPSHVIKFALDRITEHVKKRIHADIDEDICEKSDVQWDQFIKASRSIIGKSAKFKCDEIDFIGLMIKCKGTLERVKPFWPSLRMDGYKNIWIAKPGAPWFCRGIGIVVMRNFEDIINHANKYPDSKYMVQKYIERPFLFYETKFDIRQYFVITLFEDVNIWMYKDCYLRLSSQLFSLDSLSTTIHLTNYAIQKYCKNDKRCNSNVPECHMLSLAQFKAYLKKIGYDNTWPSIYESMKKSVITLIQGSLVDTEMYQKSFELYGCDFMINDKLEPYLIEINQSPEMNSTTDVKKNICPVTFEDLFKVVLDYPKNSKADTGNFELIFSTPITKSSPSTQDLLVHGISMNISHEKVPRQLSWMALMNRNKRKRTSRILYDLITHS